VTARRRKSGVVEIRRRGGRVGQRKKHEEDDDRAGPDRGRVAKLRPPPTEGTRAVYLRRRVEGEEESGEVYDLLGRGRRIDRLGTKSRSREGENGKGK